jgi:hypothetical protein
MAMDEYGFHPAADLFPMVSRSSTTITDPCHT